MLSANAETMQLTSFQDRHKNKDILVCGCGESLRDLTHPERFITIGVNDVGRLFHPDYLVVVNARRQFSGDRFRYVEQSQAKYLFTQLELGIAHPNIVKFKLGIYGGTNGSDSHVLHYTQNSPYVALCLAAHMGAKRIGLIGVDFSDNHFFGKTGRHALANQLPQIDEQYRKLRDALEKQGIEVFNLSAQSRLAAFPKMTLSEFASRSECNAPGTGKQEKSENSRHRIFFVHYRFLACGDVFATGLRHAAEELGIIHEHAFWDDPLLPQKVGTFEPDPLFVVHGRSFIRKWGDRFGDLNTAVWLLDEPYEVDDTASWSSKFRTVFVNDPATLSRHRNAHYLPVCYDPKLHRNGVRDRKYEVGFIGGYNETRERALASLAREGLLSYVVGGPWRDPALQRISIGKNVPPEETAELYRQTRIVVNVFRDIHHYNRQNIGGQSMNPRIYEAAACGALVISEKRPELQSVFPEMPLIENQTALVSTIHGFLTENEKYEAVRKACSSRLSGHTYADRLKEIIRIACRKASADGGKEFRMEPSVPDVKSALVAETVAGLEDWEDFGGILTLTPNGAYLLQKDHDASPGSERGIVSRKSLSRGALVFEINLGENACFIAKIHQTNKLDQLTNSYHLMCGGHVDYFARHNRIFKTFRLNRNAWEKVRITAQNGMLTLFHNSSRVFSVRDHHLTGGYAFLGVKGGTATIRNISLDAEADREKTPSTDVFKGTEFEVLHDMRGTEIPTVSIITTVYDRTECLEECIRTVKQLHFRQYEQLIVADSPPAHVVEALQAIVRENDDGSTMFVNLKKRYNNWGITPASIGLHLARGKYICFLSDDNGYTPEHFDHLVPVLEHDQDLGFVYSSCNYAGRIRLNHPRPAPGRIDLGQPLFHKSLFKKHLQNTLPFNEFAWDWRMIERFLQQGVKWRHVERASFLFRLAACQRTASL